MLHVGKKDTFQDQVVVDKVSGPKAAPFTRTEPEDYRIRPPLLSCPQHIGIAAELNHKRRTRLHGQFGIPHFVAIVAQSRRTISPHQKVGLAEQISGWSVIVRSVSDRVVLQVALIQVALIQVALINDFAAGLHCRYCGLNPLSLVPAGRRRIYLMALLLKLRQTCLFMLASPFGQCGQ